MNTIECVTTAAAIAAVSIAPDMAHKIASEIGRQLASARKTRMTTRGEGESASASVAKAAVACGLNRKDAAMLSAGWRCLQAARVLAGDNRPAALAALKAL